VAEREMMRDEMAVSADEEEKLADGKVEEFVCVIRLTDQPRG
jgi:hypothetical protein